MIAGGGGGARSRRARGPRLAPLPQPARAELGRRAGAGGPGNFYPGRPGWEGARAAGGPPARAGPPTWWRSGSGQRAGGGAGGAADRLEEGGLLAPPGSGPRPPPGRPPPAGRRNLCAPSLQPPWHQDGLCAAAWAAESSRPPALEHSGLLLPQSSPGAGGQGRQGAVRPGTSNLGPHSRNGAPHSGAPECSPGVLWSWPCTWGGHPRGTEGRFSCSPTAIPPSGFPVPDCSPVQGLDPRRRRRGHGQVPRAVVLPRVWEPVRGREGGRGWGDFINEPGKDINLVVGPAARLSVWVKDLC